MPKVDFYVLEQATGLQSLHYACQLVEKVYTEKQLVYIHTNSLQEAERIDSLLWTYRDDSFLPHQIYDAENTAPIQIGYIPQHAISSSQMENSHKVLLNLNSDFPLFHRAFSHIIEIVFPDPIVQQLARERFKQYRDQHCEMNTYKIKATKL